MEEGERQRGRNKKDREAVKIKKVIETGERDGQSRTEKKHKDNQRWTGLFRAWRAHGRHSSALTNHGQAGPGPWGPLGQQ